ncbi:MAG: phage baseplate assembly protein V [Acidobacteria bacterium]|nr:phage baseplate assembly protein V [Acidobacteriota bacterium]
MSSNFYGIYRAIVEDNADPLNVMRLKVSVPELSLTLSWASPCVAVDEVGVPAIGTGVWVMFERGDTDFPVWLGTWREQG